MSGRKLTPEEKLARKQKREEAKAAKAAALVNVAPPALTEPEKPEVIVDEPAPEKKKTWRLFVGMLQDTFKTNKKGEKKHVFNVMEFEEVTEVEPSAQSLSNWIIAKLTQYQALARLQGNKMFDQTLRIDLTIKIDDTVVGSGIKFSINPKQLERIIDDYPIAVSHAFNPTALGHGVTKQGILAFRNAVDLDKPLLKQDPAVNAVQKLIDEGLVAENGVVVPAK